MKANKIIKQIFSIGLSIVLISNICLAENVYVASSPVNSLNSGNGVVTSNVVYNNQSNNVYSGPTGIPSEGTVVSLTNSGTTVSTDTAGAGVSYQNPNTQLISSPRAYYQNQQNAIDQGQTSAIVNNYNLTRDSGQRVSYDDPVIFDNPGPGKYSGDVDTYNGGNATSNNTSISQQVPSTNVSDSALYLDTNVNTNNNIDTNVTIYTANTNITTPMPTVSAPSAIVVNATTKQIYYFKDPFTGYNPAGLANLMTMYLLLQHKQLTDVLSVSSRAVNNLEDGASTAGLKAGDVITVSDAITAMCIKSCCDVANCVAENVGGSIENFVAMMNQTAKSFGCVSTNFTNPSGLNSDQQIISSYDMAIIFDKVTDNPQLLYLMALTAYNLPATQHRGPLLLTTKNSLIVPGSSRHYEGISASRMGYTSKALYTMTGSTIYNGQKLIAVVMRANGTQFNDITKMLDFAKKASVDPGAQGINNQAQQQMFAQQAAQQATVTQVNTTVSTNEVTQGNWVKDSTGNWNFILADGQKALNRWIQDAGNKIYYVDSNGNMITGLRQFSNGNSYYFDTTTGELRYNTWVNLSTGAYYLQADGSIAKASPGTTTNITTAVGVYTINDTGRAIAKVSQ